MITVISLLVILFSLFAISRAIIRFKQGEMSTSEFIFWVALWVVVDILSLIPDLASRISQLFGIERGADLAVYIGIILMFYLIFRLYVKIENVQHDLTRIVRELAKKRK